MFDPYNKPSFACFVEKTAEHHPLGAVNNQYTTATGLVALSNSALGHPHYQEGIGALKDMK